MPQQPTLLYWKQDLFEIGFKATEQNIFHTIVVKKTKRNGEKFEKIMQFKTRHVKLVLQYVGQDFLNHCKI